MYILKLDTFIYDFDHEDLVDFPVYGVAHGLAILTNDRSYKYYNESPLFIEGNLLTIATLEFQEFSMNCNSIINLEIEEFTLENLQNLYKSSIWGRNVAEEVWEKFRGTNQ